MNIAFVRYGLIALIAFALLLYLFQLRLHFVLLWSYLFAINSVGFALYTVDKLAAKQGWMRVPESLLQLTALLGATPAAIVAQQFFWHKTTKRRFQVVFWLIVLLQVTLLYLVVFTDFLQNVF